MAYARLIGPIFAGAIAFCVPGYACAQVTESCQRPTAPALVPPLTHGGAALEAMFDGVEEYLGKTDQYIACLHEAIERICQEREQVMLNMATIASFSGLPSPAMGGSDLACRRR